MRQVPYYLIIGDGRVAHHFKYYFSLLDLQFKTWHRKKPLENLHKYLKVVSHVLILINDSAIEQIAQEQLQNTSATLIHFSGSHMSQYAYGAHPLMTFNESKYSLEQYTAIPFVIDHDSPDWDDLLPGLPNQHIRLHTSLKPKYHALCVLSGNFSCLLWQKLFDTFESELKIPKSFAFAYLQRQAQNLIEDSTKALTGPLIRNDTITLNNNLNALNADPFQAIFKSFISCYQKINDQGEPQ